MGLFFLSILYYGKFVPEPTNNNQINIKKISNRYIQFEKLFEINELVATSFFNEILEYYLTKMSREELVDILNTTNNSENQWFIYRYSFSTSDILDIYGPENLGTFNKIDYDEILLDQLNLLNLHDSKNHLAKIHKTYDKIFGYCDKFSSLNLTTIGKSNENLIRDTQRFKSYLQEFEDLLMTF